MRAQQRLFVWETCRVLLTVAALVLLTSIGGVGQSQGPAPRFPADRIRGHMLFLTDDLLEGRGTGSPGFEVAARYVASQFASYGLQAAGVEGYFQRVRFQSSVPIADESSLSIATGATRLSMRWGRDFVAIGNTPEPLFSADAPIVFVGYGISAPEFKHDDYATDVRGAIVAFAPGAPSSLPAARQAYYTSQKWRVAQQHGAIATIELSTEAADANWPWADRVLFASEGKGTALDADGRLGPNEQRPRIVLSTEGTAQLFRAANQSMSEVLQGMRRSELGTAAVRLASNRREMTAPHVIGLLPGVDARLRNEVVVFIAHLDGQGRGKAVDGDDIYNSALDNALGSALLLNLADAFSTSPQRPRRSVLFIAATGEELGIAGSPYFVEHPTVPLEQIVAAINIDGPSLLTESMQAISAMGAASSTLGDVVDRAARQLRLRVRSSSAPLQFSDHYPFVMKGIPALWIVGDTSALPNSAERDIAKRSIHKPTDDMTRPFQWEAAVTLAQLHFLIGMDVASRLERPRWNPGEPGVVSNP